MNEWRKWRGQRKVSLIYSVRGYNLLSLPQYQQEILNMVKCLDVRNSCGRNKLLIMDLQEAPTLSFEQVAP